MIRIIHTSLNFFSVNLNINKNCRKFDIIFKILENSLIEVYNFFLV